MIRLTKKTEDIFSFCKVRTLSPTKALPPVTETAAAASETDVSNRIALFFN
jgi:hypothetical protein